MRRVHDLEVSLAIRSAEEADELASWDAGRDSWELDTVVDLLSWSAGPGARADEGRRTGAEPSSPPPARHASPATARQPGLRPGCLIFLTSASCLR